MIFFDRYDIIYKMKEKVTNQEIDSKINETTNQDSTTNEVVVEKIKIELPTQKEKESKSSYIRRCFFENQISISDISKGSGILYQMCRNVVQKQKDQMELEQLRLLKK